MDWWLLCHLVLFGVCQLVCGTGDRADSKPDPSAHVKIVSFGEKLLTMGSIRKPKRLTVHGNDEKEYFFLVKVQWPFAHVLLWLVC